MPRKISSQQLRVFCEFQKLFPDDSIFCDYRFNFDNSIVKEYDIYIENFFGKGIHLFYENDGFPWHEGTIINDSEKTKLAIKYGHHIFRTRDNRLTDLGFQNEIVYDQKDYRKSKFKPIIIDLCRCILNVLKKYNLSYKQSILENYILSNEFINDELFIFYKNTKHIPNSLGEIDPECLNEYSKKNLYSAYSVNLHSEIFIWDCQICKYQYDKSYVEYKKYGCPNCRILELQNISSEKLKNIFDKIINKEILTTSEENFLVDKRKAKNTGIIGRFGQSRAENGCCFYETDLILANSYVELEIQSIFDIYDAEKDSNLNTLKLCDFKKNNSSKEFPYPSQNSDDQEEKSLANFRNRKLCILKNGTIDSNGNIVWNTRSGSGGILYKSDIDIAISMGCQDCFVNKESDEYIQNEKAKTLGQFYESHGRKPKQKSNDEAEAELGRFHTTLMKVVNEANSAGGEIYPSTFEILSKYNYLNLMIPTTKRRENEIKNYMNDLLQFIKDNDAQLPKQDGKLFGEKKLADKLNKLRRIKAGKLKGKFPPLYQSIAEENNLPMLFEQGFVIKK